VGVRHALCALWLVCRLKVEQRACVGKNAMDEWCRADFLYRLMGDGIAGFSLGLCFFRPVSECLSLSSKGQTCWTRTRSAMVQAVGGGQRR
jgi:hypothetical protein